MNGPAVNLVAFDAEQLNALETWFDDPETQRRLGGRPWIRRALSLLDLPIGQDFRGMVTTGRYAWVALDEVEAPVGYVDGETYERYAAWDGTDPQHPVISDIVNMPSMGLGYVIDPSRRRRGYGVATLRAVQSHPDVSHVQLFFAGIDHDNVASQRYVERAGFTKRQAEPDFEDMLWYSRSRSA
jgi:RimJ/RimL family protein N-acetyltransferase